MTREESLKTRAARLLGTAVYTISTRFLSLDPTINEVKLDTLSYSRKDKSYYFTTKAGYLKINDDGDLVSDHLFITTEATRAVEYLDSMVNSGAINKEN